MFTQIQTRCVHRDSGCTVVQLVGSLDVATSPLVKDRLITLLENGETRLIADISLVDFIDHTGLGIFIYVLNRARRHDGYLIIATGENQRLLKVLNHTRLAKAVDCFGTIEEAEASFR